MENILLKFVGRSYYKDHLFVHALRYNSFLI